MRLAGRRSVLGGGLALTLVYRLGVDGCVSFSGQTMIREGERRASPRAQQSSAPTKSAFAPIVQRSRADLFDRATGRYSALVPLTLPEGMPAGAAVICLTTLTVLPAP